MDKEKLKVIFSFIGVMFTFYILVAGIHEYGHYIWDTTHNVDVENVCLFGWNNISKTTAWTTYKLEQYYTCHVDNGNCVIVKVVKDNFNCKWDLDFSSSCPTD
jgi:hypothetical protein